jgi:hypothetical protein
LREILKEVRVVANNLMMIGYTWKLLEALTRRDTYLDYDLKLPLLKIL